MKHPGTRIRKPKERGEWAELRFMAKAAEMGFKLTKPWGDSATYDVAIEQNGRFLRVQVKSTMCKGHRPNPNQAKGVYRANMRHSSVRPYCRSDFDYLAVYVIPKDVWYIIPSAVATQKFAIRVRPGWENNQYERYREAWHLLKDTAADPDFHVSTLHAVIECGADIPVRHCL